MSATKILEKHSILHRINWWLESEGEETISENHPDVEPIVRWVSKQQADGGEISISDEEILTQMSKISINQWIREGSLEAKLVGGH